MHDITEQLLVIESDAQQAMNTIAKENAALSFKAEEDLARKISKIEFESVKAIKDLSREADIDAASRIERVKELYRCKGEILDSDFQNSKEMLRTKILREVLYGAS